MTEINNTAASATNAHAHTADAEVTNGDLVFDVPSQNSPTIGTVFEVSEGSSPKYKAQVVKLELSEDTKETKVTARRVKG